MLAVIEVTESRLHYKYINIVPLCINQLLILKRHCLICLHLCLPIEETLTLQLNLYSIVPEFSA